MFSFVQNWFAPRINPIGVDFGSDCLRMAQVQFVDGELQLVAAASTDVPSHARGSIPARVNFFVEALRDMLQQGNFRSRHAVLALPAASMYIQHLRMAKLDEDETRKALPWEARGKLPIDPSAAVMRHIVSGEVYQEQEPRNEVIVMAAARSYVDQLLDAAAKAKLDVTGMNVEPKAILDCFSHVYRRKNDAESTTCFLDIGCVASRAFIARGEQIYFARVIPVGGDHFSRAVAQALKITFEEAKLLRIRLAAAQPTADAPSRQPTVRAPEPDIDNSFPLLPASLPPTPEATPAAAAQEHASAPAQARGTSLSAQAHAVEVACREPLNKLIEELDLCRRYYESTFPNRPVDRLVFVGGEARQRAACQQIARELGVAAQLGDPMARMARVSDIGIDSGIDRRQPQPAWAVAVGLSLGPVGAGVSAAATGAS